MGISSDNFALPTPMDATYMYEVLIEVYNDQTAEWDSIAVKQLTFYFA